MLLSHARKERHRKSLHSAEEMQPGIWQSLTLNSRKRKTLFYSGCLLSVVCKEISVSYLELNAL